MYYPVLLGIMDPLYNLFGQLMSYLYDWLQNYGLVIIVFNVILKLLIMPLSFKSQKSMARQQFLQDDINEIKRVYAKDPQKANEAQMQLMRESGVSMASGCLPMVLQMLVLFAIWPPIQRPLHYIGQVADSSIASIGGYAFEHGLLSQNAFSNLGRNDIPLLAVLRDSAQTLGESVQQGWIQLRQVIDLNFLGMDLGRTPSFDPGKLFGAETWRTYIPLLILVIVMIGTQFVAMRMGKINMPRQQSKEEKEREKRNPAKSGQTPKQAEGMMKSMNIVMPVMMIFMAFTLPAAMALFWLVSNVMAIIQTYLTYVLYTKPMREILDKQDAEKLVSRRRSS